MFKEYCKVNGLADWKTSVRVPELAISGMKDWIKEIIEG
jgi:hypothetical protein